MSVILWSFGIWSKQERWKNSVSGCLTIWPNIKKIVVLKCLLLFYTTMNHFLIRLWCTMKSRFYVIISDDQLRDCTKKLQSTNLHKKGHSQCLVICCLSDPLQLSESSETITSEKHAQQINETHWKLQHLQLVLVNRKCPILHENTQPDVAQPMHQMLNELGYKVLPHLPYSSDLSPTDDHFFKHLDNFCKENASTTSQMQKMLSMSLSNPKAWIFTQ